MKNSYCCFILKILLVYITKVDTLYVDEETGFCAAINSLLHSNVFSYPLHIQFIDGTFGNCIKPTNSTYLVNVCVNAHASPIARSSLIIVKSVDQLFDINFGCMEQNGHNLLVIQSPVNESSDNELMSAFWDRFIIGVTLLSVKHSQIVLQTFMPFNDGQCNDTQLRMINRFDDRSQKWENDLFFPDKLRNFKKCPITVTTYRNIVPYIVHDEIVDGETIVKGRVIEIVRTLAFTLNFTIDLDYHPSLSGYENCIEKVTNREAEMFFGNIFLDLSRSNLDFSAPIFFELLKFVVPPGRSYTQFENLTRRFDSLTWMLIACALVASSTLVCIITFGRKETKIHSFGIGYENGFMDFIAGILGMPHWSTPRVSISRVIIIKFVLCAFVIRTLYQATLFKFLHSEGRVKPVQSIDEIIKKGYTVHSVKLYENIMSTQGQKHASR